MFRCDLCRSFSLIFEHAYVEGEVLKFFFRKFWSIVPVRVEQCIFGPMAVTLGAGQKGSTKGVFIDKFLQVFRKLKSFDKIQLRNLQV